MNRTTDMTAGNPAKLILGLAVPLILTSLGQQMYGIIDAVIVGRGVGVNAFAALGACDWLVWLVLWTVSGLTQGFSTLIARSFGAGDEEKLHQVIGMCVRLCLYFGLALTIICLIAAGPVLALLHTPEEIFRDARLYLRMIWGGTFITIAYNMSASALRAAGDGKTPLIAMVTAGFTNIALDLLFVMGLHMGIFGAALATLMAQMLAFLYCLAIILRSPVFFLEKRHFSRNRGLAAKLCRTGFPMALSSVVVALGGIIAQKVINFYGPVFVAGCTAANKLHQLMDCSALALGFASTAYIGQNYGAGRLDRIREGIRKATVIALILGGSISVFMILFGRPAVGFFLSAGTENADAALEVAYQYVIVMSAMLISAYLMNLYHYSLQGIGNSRDPMISGLFQLGARVFTALVFPLFLGQFGVFFMDGNAWCAAGIFQIICFYRTLGKLEKTG